MNTPSRTKIKPGFISGILVSLAAVFVLIVILMLTGPMVGSVYSTINDTLSAELSMPGYSGVLAVTRSGPEENNNAGRLIIRKGALGLVVKDTLATQQEIKGMVADMTGAGAFVVSSSASGASAEGAPYIRMSIRIPAARFDEVMDRLAGMAIDVQNREETGVDVTAEYVDLESRLEALEAARDRLMEIMKNAATTEDLILAEKQLTEREEEIESIKGQMKFLSESAQLSLIDIQLSPSILNQPMDTSWRPAETARRSLDNLVASLRSFADFLIVFVISILPWLLLIAAIGYGIYRVARRKKPLQDKAETTEGK